MAAPSEIRLSALLIFGAGLVFVLLGVALLGVDAYASATALRPPIATAVLGFAIAVGLVLRMRMARGVAMVAVIVFALLHVVIMFSQGQWFARVGSGVLAAAYIYAGVLLNTGPAREHLRGGA
ncbi:MAG: hypothetical protein GEU98_00465 [Pseudonocardiaceae bacterium]|nr:hypothetical protein [Pseudonocardiaceae bacterium]